MRYKLSSVAVSVAMAVSGSANAAIGAQNEIYIGGATAPQNFMLYDTVQRICDASAATIKVYVDEIAALPGNGNPNAGTPIMNHKDQFAVHCTTETFADDTSTPTIDESKLSAVDLAIYKFNGGSATGVAPVADPANAQAADIQQLDAGSGCTLVTNARADNTWQAIDGSRFELYDCSNSTVAQVPDGGISDVEPTVFVGPLALNAGKEPVGVASQPAAPFVDKGNLVVQAGPGAVFGTIVSMNMYDELGHDQYIAGMLTDCDALIGDGNSATAPTAAEWNASTRAQRDTLACMPSLPQSYISSVESGQFLRWTDRNPYGLPLDMTGLDTNLVQLCRRTAGSGTHAQASVENLRTNCIDGAPAMPESLPGGNPLFGLISVYANSGSSDMSDCVDAFSNGNGFDGDFASLPPTIGDPDGDSDCVPGLGVDCDGDGNAPAFHAFGLGYNSTENNTGLNFDYRFVKVDGVAPTLENAHSGNYRDVYYLSYQHRVDASGNIDGKTGTLRANPLTAAQQDVAKAYFSVWDNVDPTTIVQVNNGLIVDPDGIPGNGDEWQGGFIAPSATASQVFSAASPETPWSRTRANAAADSCQPLTEAR